MVMKYLAAFLVLAVVLAAGASVVIAWPIPMLLSGNNSRGGVPSPPTGIACDQGPNFTGTVPPQVAQAGFNHCAVNADWTTSSTDANGINYSLPQTWLSECGATTSAAWHQLYINNRTGQGDTHHLYFCPLTNAIIVQDPVFGGQVLKQQFDPAQFVANGWTLLELSWPAGRYGSTGQAGGPSGQGLFPNTYYTRIVFRMDPVTFTGIASNGDVILDSFWLDKCCYAGTTYETDYFDGIQWSGGDFDCNGNSTCRMHENTYSLANPINVSPKVDIAATYHTAEYLTTVDTNTGGNIGVCGWLDGTGFGCGTGLNMDGNTAMNQAFGYQIKNWIGQDECTNGPNGPGCLSNPATIYIKQITMISCSTYFTAPCLTNPIITTQ